MKIQAIQVKQWLSEWDHVHFDSKLGRKKPQPSFYLFALDAKQLHALCGIYRRTLRPETSTHARTGIQRRHDPQRSQQIGDYVRYGYPWPELSEAKQSSGTFDDLRKPGWLPTAIVVNILGADTTRRSRKVAKQDLVRISSNGAGPSTITLPNGLDKDGWKPTALPPLEVIDGQHRLWAFSEESNLDGFQLPVVAFDGLDISWQAYLFWTINIRPKRINASLAFDLYPLMRTEDWLEKFFGHSIYRETRAQELTEALWSHQSSPWYHFVNMLGEAEEAGKPRPPGVSQAAWIRSLLATFIKAWESPRAKIGGLFGARIRSSGEELPWTRAQQAAFLIAAGCAFRDAVGNCRADWAKAVRNADRTLLSDSEPHDPAFYGKYTLIGDDMGLRGFLYIINDLCFVRAADLKLDTWDVSDVDVEPDEKNIGLCLKSLAKHPVSLFLRKVCACLAEFDWRSSAEPTLSDSERREKAAFRGTGGYKELRLVLLAHLRGCDEAVKKPAADVSKLLSA